MNALLPLLLAAAWPVRAAEPAPRTLSTLAQGWELDRVGETGQLTLPRVAWSRDLNTVLYVSRSGGRRGLAVNGSQQAVDEVDVLSFSPNGLVPIYSVRRGGHSYLSIGDKMFGPYDRVERPAVNEDASRVAFKAVVGSRQRIIVDGKTAAEGAYESAPVLDALGRAAWWERSQDRWTLWWDGKPAPGTPFTAHGNDPEQVGDPVFSADGKHIAFRRRDQGGRAVIVWDGAPGAPYLAVGEPVFSPDGSALAYGAASGPDYDLNTLFAGDRTVTVLEPPGAGGAKATRPLTIRYVWQWRYLQDGRLMYFASLMDGRTCFVIGDAVSAEFPSAAEPAFDPASRRAAFIARGDKTARAVVDGDAGPEYDAVHYVQFDPGGRRWAYTAEKDSATFVVADGKPGARYDEVGWVRFSDGGDTLAYWARRGGRWYTVVNGVESPAGAAANLVGNLILAGKDGTAPVYSARESGRWFLYVDGKKTGPYDEVGPFRYDAGLNAVVAGTREGRAFMRRVLALP